MLIAGNEQRLTWVHTNKNSLATDPLSAGIPSYVIQEEFCRFQGFWWQPVMTGNRWKIFSQAVRFPSLIYLLFSFRPDGVFRILVEEVDESDVGIIKFPSFNGDGGVEEYRFVSSKCKCFVSLLIMRGLKWGKNTDFHVLARQTRNQI